MAPAHAALRFAFAAAALVASRDIHGANAQSTCTSHSDCLTSEKYPGRDFDLETRADGEPARQSECAGRHSLFKGNFSQVKQCADACRGHSQWFKFGRRSTYEKFTEISYNCKDKSDEEKEAVPCTQGPCTEVDNELLCDCYCEAEGSTSEPPVCSDDPTGDLAARDFGCGRLVGMGCGTDLSALSSELPAGTLVKIGCPVSCGACDDPIVVAAIQSALAGVAPVGCDVRSSIITKETVVLDCPCIASETAPCPPGSEDEATCTANYAIMPDFLLTDMLDASRYAGTPIAAAKAIIGTMGVLSSFEALMATEVVPYDLFKCASVSQLCYLARFVRGARD